MPSSDTSTDRSGNPEPEILTPAAQRILSEWTDRQEVENQQLERLEDLARLMDARFHLPLVPIPIGLDTIIGLIPGIGDTVSLGVSGIIIAGARRLGVPKKRLIQMSVNVFIDWLIGLIPVLGDLLDIGWQGNMRNVQIARRELEARWGHEYAGIMNKPEYHL